MAQPPSSNGVPFASPSPTPPQDYQHIEATPSEFGGLIAQGGEKLGEGAITATKFYAQIAAQQAVNGWQDQANQTLADFKKLRGQDAMDAEPDVRQKLQESQDEAGSGLALPASQLEFNQNIRFLRSRFEAEVGNHYDQQAQEWGIGVNQATFGTATNELQDATLRGDQAGVIAAQKKISDALIKTEQLKYGQSLTPAMTADVLNRATAHSAVTQIEALMPTQPGRAQQVLDANRGALPGGVYDTLSTKLKEKNEDIGIQRGLDDAFTGGGGGAPVRQIDDATAGRAKQVYDGLIKRGMDPSTAIGFAANAVGESGANPQSKPGDQGASHGAFMWRGDRLTAYQKRYGHSPEQGSLDEQLDFVTSELHGSEATAGQLIDRAGNSPAEKAAAISKLYERPQDVALNASVRGNYAQQLAVRFGLDGGAIQPVSTGSPTGNAAGPSAGPMFPGQIAPLHAGPDTYTNYAQIWQRVQENAKQMFPDDDKAQQRMIAEGQNRINFQISLENHAEVAAQKQRTDYDNASYGAVVKGVYKDPVNFDITPYMTDPNLSGEGAEKILRVKNYAMEQAGQPAFGYSPAFNQAYKDILSPVGTLGHINSQADIVARGVPNGGDLNLKDMQKIGELYAKVHVDPDQYSDHLRAQALLQDAKKYLSFESDDGYVKLRDPTGEHIYLGMFTQDFMKGFDQVMSTGDRTQIDDYLSDKTVKGLLKQMPRTPAQMEKDRLAASGQSVPGEVERPGQPLPPAPTINDSTKINPDAWNESMKTLPVNQSGQPFTHAAWAEYLTRLLKNPDPKTIQYFDQHFGGQGFSGEEIVKSLTTPYREPIVPPQYPGVP
jgi:hypothetical protein